MTATVDTFQVRTQTLTTNLPSGCWPMAFANFTTSRLRLSFLNPRHRLLSPSPRNPIQLWQRMNYQTSTLTTSLTTSSNQLPVTLQQAKNQLDIVNDDNDAEIRLCLDAAIDYCERVTGRSLRVSHTVTQSYSQWPCAPVRFDWQPAYSISSVKYYDADDTLQTVDSDDYRLIQSNVASVLEFGQAFAFPATYDRSDAVQVTYLAGYATVSDVPACARHAILLALQKDWGSTPVNEIPRIERALATKLAAIDTGAYR